MEKFLSILGLLVFSLVPQPAPSFGVEGSSSGGGGGIAEKNLIYAHLNFQRYIDICLQSPTCRLNAHEHALLTKIRNSHPLEGAPDRQLIFRSEKETPGFFILDGAERIAKTGGSIGDSIFVNRDLLYPVVTSGTTHPLSLGGSVGLLVHEFGHHHGEASHERLDSLGSKVEVMMEVNCRRRFETAPFITV